MRKMGAELEFEMWEDRSCQYMSDLINEIAQRQDMTCQTREAPDHWTMKTDHCGWELTTPAFEATWSNFRKVRQIIEDMRREICYRHNVSRNPNNTGLHVHIDITDLAAEHLRNMVNIFRTFEPALRELQHRSRIDSRWVTPLTDRSDIYYDQYLPNLSPTNINMLTDHNYGMNLSRYECRGTVEIRYGGTSVRGRKVINWMQVLCFLIEASKKVENYQRNECGSLEDLYEFMRSVETGTWLDRRVDNLIIWMERRHRQLYHRQEWREERDERNRQRRIARGEEVDEPANEENPEE